MDALTYPPNAKIVVVDDNARVLQAMSKLLEFEGFSVLTAQNGLDALNKMRTADHISLVLTWRETGGNFCAEREATPT